MNETEPKGLLNEIEALRQKFTNTQELYREVCALLFFRHGVTPTANRLYQLVRKGSMNAPAEALNDFWKTLREKSRVRIEHPDLPDELKATAGELIGTLWSRARMAAESQWQTQREELLREKTTGESKCASLESEIVTLTESLNRNMESLEESKRARQEHETVIMQFGEERASLESRCQSVVSDAAGLRLELDKAKSDAEVRIQSLRESGAASELRLNKEIKSLREEIAKEKQYTARLRSELEKTRLSASKQTGQQLARMAKLEGDVEKASQKSSALEDALNECRTERDGLRELLNRAVMPQDSGKLPTRRARGRKSPRG